ncbi:MAG: hypothetical protein WCK67_07465 [bacterium]
MQLNNKKCPFKLEKCSNECSLYIDPEELNETVKNKLASLGVIDRKSGICSFKNMALAMSRTIFENNHNSSCR